jgi:hypothetical protein
MLITTLNTGVQKSPCFLAYLLHNEPHKSKYLFFQNFKTRIIQNFLSLITKFHNRFHKTLLRDSYSNQLNPVDIPCTSILSILSSLHFFVCDPALRDSSIFSSRLNLVFLNIIWTSEWAASSQQHHGSHRILNPAIYQPKTGDPH